MRFGIDSLVYLLATLAGTLALTGCSNSLHRRNENIGHQSDAAKARGITLIITTKDILASGYVLSVGGGGIAIGALILFLYSLHITPVKPFQRKLFFLSPLALAFNSLITIASALSTTIIAKTGSATAKASLGQFQIPDSTLQAQLKASGISLAYWSNGYVRFMVGAAWPAVILGPIATVLAYKAYKKERPSAHSGDHVVQQMNATPSTPMDDQTEKHMIEHVDRD